jgi:hypothetical protein
MYLYLSLIPEALIASMLAPSEFGSYLAVGNKKRTLGQAMFFSIEGYRKSEVFDLAEAEKRCVPKPNGESKHSVYLSIYRVLEQIPLEVLRNLYLVTPDGRVLELAPSARIPASAKKYHLYQEICPVHPRIVSSLGPQDFTRHITSRETPIHLPRILFVDLRLGELADDPEKAGIRDLPYHAIEHLRDCLIELKNNPEKHTKIVDRIHPQSFPYRSVDTGFYLGGRDELLFYPFPAQEDLQSKYYEWWRSASIMGDMLGNP